MTVTGEGRKILIPTVLFAIFLILSITTALKNSPTVDEVSHHIPSGYVYLTKGDIRFATDSPPLARYIAALPLLALKMNLPDDRGFWAREDRGAFGKEFLYDINKNADRAVFLSRLMIIFITGMGGFFLYFWLSKNFSVVIANVAAFFYFLEPNMIAHGSLATTDALLSVFVMISVLLFWSFLKNMNVKTALLCGFFTGLALLTKYSALVLLPAYLIIYAVDYCMKRKDYVKKRGISLLVLVMITAFITLWCGYGFETKTFMDGTLRQDEKIEFVSNIFKNFAPAFEDKGAELVKTAHVPLSSYILGVMGVMKHGQEGGNFFLGKYNPSSGNPFYYLVAIGIKTPVPLLILLFTGIIAGLKLHKAFTAYLIFISAFFIVPASLSNLQIGLRYILPVYPLFFIIAGGAIYFLNNKNNLYKKYALGILILSYTFIHVVTWPRYLSYFNFIIGGPRNGYKYLRDSNIDWGQGLKYLKEDMKKIKKDKITLKYFGSTPPVVDGVKVNEFTEADIKSQGDKVYGISINYIDSVKWTKDNKPNVISGDSIAIYDFTKANITTKTDDKDLKNDTMSSRAD